MIHGKKSTFTLYPLSPPHTHTLSPPPHMHTKPLPPHTHRSEVLSPVTAGVCGVVEMNVVQRVQLPLFPTKCSTCGRLASRLGEGRRIMRCGQCKAVGYCDR